MEPVPNIPYLQISSIPYEYVWSQYGVTEHMYWLQNIQKDILFLLLVNAADCGVTSIMFKALCGNIVQWRKISEMI
jgi:hypothetical protein